MGGIGIKKIYTALHEVMVMTLNLCDVTMLRLSGTRWQVRVRSLALSGVAMLRLNVQWGACAEMKTRSRAMVKNYNS
jgi:hypothetical protein